VRVQGKEGYEEQASWSEIDMTIVVLLATVGVAVGVLLIWSAARGQRCPPELRGDWWTAFEREFQAYAASTTRTSKRDAGRRRERPSSS
jgi:uncharacterized lipoprotein YddW (UPF0748 family)